MTSHAASPIEVVVGFPPNGASDRVAQAVLPAMAAALGRSMTVVNRAGEEGNPAARFVAAAPADGCTLLLGNNGLLAANPLLFPDIGYDPLTDFSPIGLLGLQPSVLVVGPSLSVRGFAELVAIAESSPDRLAMAVSGYGSAAHLAGELFRSRTRVSLREAGYDGAKAALDDLASGKVDFMFATASSVLGRISADEVRPLAVTTAKRTAVLPKVPTLDEVGLTGFDVASWHGLAAPAGTPRAIVNSINRAASQALGDDGVRAALEALAIDVAGGTPEDFAAHIAAEIPKWAELVRASGASAPPAA